jgi:Asp/Glu/hydantoin racemase
VAATGRFGATYIASRAAAAIAAHAALDAFAEHGDGADVVLLACFGDPGLLALREISTAPVVGMAEASCHEAAGLGARFSIVTGGERWSAMLTEFVQTLGLSARLASVRTVAATGAAIAEDPDGALAVLGEACRSCAVQDGAASVVLGGAGLVGLADRLAPLVPVPVICSLKAAVAACLATEVGSRTSSRPPSSPVSSTGLSPALAARLGP